MIDVTERLHGPDGIEAAREILRLRPENEKLREALREKDEEISNLREALKPFSDAASTDDYIDDIEIAETDKARKITFGDLRRARALLNGDN